MMISIGGGDAVARAGLEIPTHDYIANTYSGSNLTTVVFRRGGASGTVVATLTMTYDGSNNLLTVTRS
jgi:hypothetical protein